MKEQWLLRPLVVSALHSFPSIRLAPSLSHLLPSCTQRLVLYPCHATFPPASTHNSPPTITRTPTGSNFACRPLQPLASSPAILLLLPFDQLVSLARKPVYLSSVFSLEVWAEAYSIFLFYRTESYRARRGIHSSKYRGRRWKASFSLSRSYP